jgi:ribonuclease P protein component
VETIRSSREIDEIFRRGSRHAHPLLLMLVTPSARGPETGRVSFVAGRRVGPAVARNRAKRVLREAARRAGAPWAGADVVLVARAETGSAGVTELDAAVMRLLARAGLS